ncbi:MAG TPA: hypothetical protein VH684_11605 [Xanthobacteraceae bacterium]
MSRGPAEKGTEGLQSAACATETPEKVPKDVLAPFGADDPGGVGPPEKLSPGSAGTEHGAKSKSKSQRQFSKAKRTPTQEDEAQFFTITDGQTTIGYVRRVGRQFFPSDAAGRKLGVCLSLKVAFAKVNENAAGS